MRRIAMTAKEYLSQYRKAQLDISNIEREIADLEDRITSLGSAIGEGMPRSQNYIGTDALIAELVDLKREKSDKMLSAQWKAIEIETAIDKVEDPIYHRLLIDRYIHRMTWAEITEDMPGYNDEANVRTRLHGRALLEAAEILKAEGLI